MKLIQSCGMAFVASMALTASVQADDQKPSAAEQLGGPALQAQIEALHPKATTLEEILALKGKTIRVTILSSVADRDPATGCQLPEKNIARDPKWNCFSGPMEVHPPEVECDPMDPEGSFCWITFPDEFGFGAALHYDQSVSPSDTDIQYHLKLRFKGGYLTKASMRGHVRGQELPSQLVWLGEQRPISLENLESKPLLMRMRGEDCGDVLVQLEIKNALAKPTCDRRYLRCPESFPAP